MPNHPRLNRKSLSSPWARVFCTCAAAVVCVAVSSAWLGRASAQQPPNAGNLVVPTTPGSAAADAQAKEKAEEPPTPAELVIDEARAKLAKLQSYAAEIAERVEMLDQPPLAIKGRCRKAADYRVYFLLTLSGLPETTGTMLQVCDGETLWDYQAIMESQSYHKFSIRPVMERLNSPLIEPKMREQFKDSMGFAGPDVLLTGLRRAFRFEQEKEEGKLGDKPVWILRGTWKSRQGMIGPDQRQVALVGLLPPYIPNRAMLYLGKDDGWPYKLVLKGQRPTILTDTRKKGPDGRYIGSKSSIETVAPTSITLEYSEVKLNPALNLGEFAFQAPSAASVEDGTEMIIKQLEQVIASQDARKKDETTKKDGPVLDQSLEVPPPPGAPPAGEPARP